MKVVEIYQNNKKVYNGPIYLANNFYSRLIGLMGKDKIGDEEGMFFRNVNRIHTFFMKFDIDVVYLNKEYEVLDVETIQPNKIGKFVKGAKHVLELNANKGAKLTKQKIDVV
ncbi:MAG: DUF192 domain-containing protein [Erysipelotrichaceae bacterium]|jgi:uncharacterized membrane protein (UPF0127 family)|nr:DUF192 domain-containing protein [Erysipelotrichaceae bacterium]